MLLICFWEADRRTRTRSASVRSLKIEIKPAATAVALGWVTLILISAGFLVLIFKYGLGHDRVFGLADLFDLDMEANFPTLFSFLLLALCSMLSFSVGSALKKPARGSRSYWTGLGGVMLYIALDEMFMIHEQVTTLVRSPFDAPYPFYVSWVLPYSLLAGGVLLIYLPFIRRLPPEVRRLVTASGALYVAGALGFEILGGVYLSTHEGGAGFGYNMIVVVEESLEMAGALLLVYALSVYLRTHLGVVAVRIVPPRRPQLIGSPAASAERTFETE